MAGETRGPAEAEAEIKPPWVGYEGVNRMSGRQDGRQRLLTCYGLLR